MPAEPALGLLTAILGLAVGVYIGSFSNEDRFTKGRQEIAVATADIVLVRTNPLDVTSILGLARATYLKMVQNLGWATGYNVVAIPVAAGVLYTYGIVLVPAVGTMLMSLSTVIVAINSRFWGQPKLWYCVRKIRGYFFFGSGTPRSLQIFLASILLISVCLGIAERLFCSGEKKIQYQGLISSSSKYSILVLLIYYNFS